MLPSTPTALVPDFASHALTPWLVPAFLLLGAAGFVGLAAALSRTRFLGRLAATCLWGAAGLLAGALVVRTIEADHLPGQSPFEALLVSATCTAIAGALTALRVAPASRARGGAVVLSALLAGLALRASAARVSGVYDLSPSLGSNLFVPHLAGMYVGYGFLMLSSLLAAAAWVSARHGAPDPAFGRAADFGLRLGFVALTVGIASAAHWSQEAWGNYWVWDPNSVAALAAWLLFLLVLLQRRLPARRRRGWVPVVAVLVLALGFTRTGILPGSQRGFHSFTSPDDGLGSRSDDPEPGSSMEERTDRVRWK